MILLTTFAFASDIVKVADTDGLAHHLPHSSQLAFAWRALGQLPPSFPADQYMGGAVAALERTATTRVISPDTVGVDAMTLTDDKDQAAHRGSLADHGVDLYVYVELYPAENRVNFYAYAWSTARPVEPIDCLSWEVSVSSVAETPAAPPASLAHALPSTAFTLDDLASGHSDPAPTEPAARAPALVPRSLPPVSPVLAAIRPAPGIGAVEIRGVDDGDFVRIDGVSIVADRSVNLAVGAHRVEVTRYDITRPYDVLINASRTVEIAVPTSKRGWLQSAH